MRKHALNRKEEELGTGLKQTYYLSKILKHVD